jgi:hypothetical protein
MIKFSIDIYILISLKLKDLKIKVIVWALFRMNRKVLFADPAPLMLADLAYHMRTAPFFLYFNSTVFARSHVF